MQRKQKRPGQARAFFCSKNDLVVSVFFLRMVRHIANTRQLGNTLEQRALDALFEGHVGLTTALTATAKLQNGDVLRLFFDHVDQADLTTVAGKARLISVCR